MTTTLAEERQRALRALEAMKERERKLKEVKERLGRALQRLA